MKHNQNNNRRNRSRGNGRKYPNQKGGSFDSNGPEAKVRGNAAQVLEKYQALARDANSAGDRILAEGYLQHAEHYYRILNTDNENANRENNNRGRQDRDNREVNSAGDVTSNVQQSSSEDAAQNDNTGRRDNPRRRNQKPSEPVETANDVSAAEEIQPEDLTQDSSAEVVDVVAAKEETPKKPRTRRPRKPRTPAADSDISDVPQAAD